MRFSATLFHCILCSIVCWVSCLKKGSINDVGSETGIPAILGQFPYQALIETKWYEDKLDHTVVLCGGSIISERWILTTANCVKKAKSPADVSVIIGTINLKESHENGTTVRAQNIHNHREFNDKTLQNNLALIYLDSVVKYSATVAPIDIPGIDYIANIGYVTGWATATIPNDTLMYSEAARLEDDICEKCFAKSQMREEDEDNYTYNKITNFCTLRPPCADDGSPFAVTDDGHHLQVGIISTDIGCNGTKISIYMDLSQYSDWIASTQVTTTPALTTTTTTTTTRHTVTTTKTSTSTQKSSPKPVTTSSAHTTTITTKKPLFNHTTPNSANTITFEQKGLLTVLSCTMFVLHRL